MCCFPYITAAPASPELVTGTDAVGKAADLLAACQTLEASAAAGESESLLADGRGFHSFTSQLNLSHSCTKPT